MDAARLQELHIDPALKRRPVAGVYLIIGAIAVVAVIATWFALSYSNSGPRVVAKGDQPQNAAAAAASNAAASSASGDLGSGTTTTTVAAAAARDGSGGSPPPAPAAPANRPAAAAAAIATATATAPAAATAESLCPHDGAAGVRGHAGARSAPAP